jgi:2'-5' RNA ligase
MDKIAIGVVLIPSDEIVELCIKINKRAFDVGKGRYKLGKKDFIPHITLVLGCIKQDNLENVKSIVKQILRSQISLKLKTSGIELYKREDGNRSFLQVGISERLRHLHETVLEKISNFLTSCDSANVLFEGDKTGISDSSMKILNNFKKEYSRENYNPHITLHCYDADKFSQGIKFPILFRANRIAICHLGNGCVVRKILFESKF